MHGRRSNAEIAVRERAAIHEAFCHLKRVAGRASAAAVAMGEARDATSLMLRTRLSEIAILEERVRAVDNVLTAGVGHL